MPDSSADKSTLTLEAIISTAIRLADEHGLEKLSMRRLAGELGVQAMSLYHHIPGRDALLDGMVDSVFAEIELPAADEPWLPAMRRRAESARAALLRHRWAVSLMDSRAQPGPATLRHHEAVLGNLRRGGFSVAGAAKAFSLLDAYVYGFVLQEAALPFNTPAEAEQMAQQLRAVLSDSHPNLTEMLVMHVLDGEYAYAREFHGGLDLILDSLRRDAASREEPA